MADIEENNSIPETIRRKVNRNAIISILLAAALLVTFFLGFFISDATQSESRQKLNEMMRLLEEVSVLSNDKTADDYAQNLVALVQKEDPYAAYYSPEEYKKILAEDSGRYSGIGLGFFANGTVGKVYHNSPAHKAGIKIGDLLYSGVYKGDETADEGEKKYTVFSDKLVEINADKEEKDKLTLFDIYGDFLGGYEDEEDMPIKVRRGEEILEKTIKRADYIVSYVEYADSEKYFYFSTELNEITGEEEFLSRERDLDAENPEDGYFITLPEDTAYIKLHEFEGDAAEQFSQAIDYMEARNRTKLVLDLRDNGGGLINVLLDIASRIINDNGKQNISILKVQEKSALTHNSTSANRFYSALTDIAVIANGSTASASECLIGALYDYGDAEKFQGASFNLNRLILTEYNAKRGYYCTYGKGIRQTTYSLKSGGAFKLTTAYIYWPLSEGVHEAPVCIQDIGITTEVSENCVTDDKAIARASAVLHLS